MNATRKRLDFQLRASMVYEVISNGVGPMSMDGIAERAGMTRSPYLREIVDTLWSREFVEKTIVMGERGHGVVVYWAVKPPDW